MKKTISTTFSTGVDYEIINYTFNDHRLHLEPLSHLTNN